MIYFWNQKFSKYGIQGSLVSTKFFDQTVHKTLPEGIEARKKEIDIIYKARRQKTAAMSLSTLELY